MILGSSYIHRVGSPPNISGGLGFIVFGVSGFKGFKGLALQGLGYT